ncbi:redoxin domain-containing protein [Mollicutes bacterium LVI A0039]|nr:redoxin domain-containing protein [Mollicutes bacterium LVI A0039]
MKKLILTLAFILVIVTGCGREEASPLAADDGTCGAGEGCTLSKQAYVGYNVGDQFPNIALIDAEGNETMLYDLVEGNDKFVLSLAADWCGDCKRQNQKLDEYYPALADQGYGAAVMYVNYSSSDGSKTTSEEIMVDFINEMNYSFPAFYDKDGAFIKEYGGLSAVPYNFILDENAIIKGITAEVDADNLFLDNSETSRM